MMDICEKFLINICVKMLHFLSSIQFIQHRSRPELYITQPTNSENGGVSFCIKFAPIHQTKCH